MRARAVLFDLDNTLTPRRECVERFAEPFAAHWGDRLEPVAPSRLRALLVAADRGGYNPDRAGDLLSSLRWRDPPSRGEVEAYWQAGLPLVSIVRPGVHEVLAALAAAGAKLGCVTNGGVAGQQAKLDHLGLARRFDAVVISDAVGCAKPDPRIFAIATARLGVDAADAWFVGDHPENDVLGATRFGMRAVWIRDGHTWPDGEPPPRHVVRGFAELARVLGVEPRRDGGTAP